MPFCAEICFRFLGDESVPSPSMSSEAIMISRMRMDEKILWCKVLHIDPVTKHFQEGRNEQPRENRSKRILGKS